VKSRLVMVTGWRGAGKTSFCRKMAEILHTSGRGVGGILSPGVFASHVKTAIQAQDLRSGESRLLASITQRNADDLFFGEWYFDRSSVAWCNHLLRTCLPSDLLIVDELGPLEFMLGEGWQAAFGALNTPAYRMGLVVIRPELEEEARRRLPITHTLFIEPGSDLQSLAQAWGEQVLTSF